jgi:hypothetical protein
MRDPFIQNISQLTGEEIPSKKEEEEHHWREDLKENSRTGREIVDLLGVFFSLLFSHVVLLFKHEYLYNL